MKIAAYEAELQQIDPDLSIKSSPTKGLAGIYHKGSFLVSIPDDEIFDEQNNNYGVSLWNDNFVIHRTRPIATAMVKGHLERIAIDPDYKDAFFGTGIYADDPKK
jgi:hypothetical protein